jgi:hypothetical protein
VHGCRKVDIIDLPKCFINIGLDTKRHIFKQTIISATMNKHCSDQILNTIPSSQDHAAEYAQQGEPIFKFFFNFHHVKGQFECHLNPNYKMFYSLFLTLPMRIWHCKTQK